MFWIAVAIVIVGFFWYLTKQQQQAIEAQKAGIPIAASRLAVEDWVREFFGALEKRNITKCQTLMATELIPAYDDAVRTFKACVEKTEGKIDEEAWAREFLRRLRVAAEAANRAALVFASAYALSQEMLGRPWNIDELVPLEDDEVVTKFVKRESEDSDTLLFLKTLHHAMDVGKTALTVGAPEEVPDLTRTAHEAFRDAHGLLRLWMTTTNAELEQQAAPNALQAGDGSSPP